MGGHIYECSECSHTVIHYNSCRNRHCPMCQGIKKHIWVDQRNKEIIDAKYFHTVFTVPHELHPLIYQNQKLLYDLLYKTVSKTLTNLSLDKKYLGAKIGFFCVLHTWSKDIHYHPHIHVVVLAGGLTKTNQWKQSKKNFFIPVKVLSKVFRGKYLQGLRRYYNDNLLNFYKSSKAYRNKKAFNQLIDTCYRKDWYTYTKETFSSPVAVIKYLARYTHRIAISNERIKSIDKSNVTIEIKKDGHTKTLVLKGIEFIRRFLLHTLPKGFVKIRYYGILANRNKANNIALCRKLTNSVAYSPKYEGLSMLEILILITKKDVTLCPKCKKGNLKRFRTLQPNGIP
jgi:hypothetical protein